MRLGSFALLAVIDQGFGILDPVDQFAFGRTDKGTAAAFGAVGKAVDFGLVKSAELCLIAEKPWFKALRAGIYAFAASDTGSLPGIFKSGVVDEENPGGGFW